MGAFDVIGGFVGDAFNVYSGVTTFNASIDQGDHPAIATGKALIDFGFSEMLYGGLNATGVGLAGSLGFGLAVAAGSAAIDLGMKAMENTGKSLGEGSDRLKGLGSGHVNMTQAGYTMRQRSLNAIRSNGANINSAFGNEARNYYLGL